MNKTIEVPKIVFDTLMGLTRQQVFAKHEMRNIEAVKDYLQSIDDVDTLAWFNADNDDLNNTKYLKGLLYGFLIEKKNQG